jgi:hypothetical protein
MLSLIDPSTVPPGGFRYLQKETKTTLSGPSLPELLMKVRDHRLANNLPISLEWKQQVEHDMCEEMPPNVCRHVFGVRDVPLPPAHRPLSIAEVLSGIKTLGAWMFQGFTKISQEEADARSRICAACPHNQEAEGCTVCASNAMREAVESVIGRARTVAHDSLKTCGVCGCQLKLAVWTPIELILKHAPLETSKLAPEWCWKIKTS